MKIKDNKIQQNNRLSEICQEKEVDYNSLVTLLNSVKTKKLLRRNNYHSEKINEIIEKATK